MEFNLPKELLDLFTSRVRLKILQVFIPQPDKMFFVREVTRMVGEEVNAVRRELERMHATGLLRIEKRANRVYYQARTDFLFYNELLRMIGKTTGLAYVLSTELNTLGKLKYVLIATAFIRGRTSGPNDIDLVLVGDVTLDKLQVIIRKYEAEAKREVNYTVMTEDEFAFRRDRGDAFVASLLSQPQVVLVGDEVELYR
ncbi:hypothetical protein CO180_01120 [candidate division WWE3 bacterium CG_4_9_14_3_um_filter_41_6]|uniref:HTH arsR-type domain-containing protein n=1 Tax=candidate division WWE3 bacterium CG_4_10_14_0_2_um_filter_41_14 TaxID=1975072 RepID=A0A2M7TIG8_UNCKA|nr:MAG: hypothetical protein COY32_03765 [candidate division WWE3 bacterium CG_4_10_14_0_2_um_filter_41_14]PJA39265.1 MAG: hypothetical protein CO180_01120 [candidate division WWE3 bacterium CG_4_9_14_3_um_filter_41_6]